MKALFYLPVVTPWWFESIIAPLIRCMATEWDVAVLAPQPWANTGIGQREMALLTDMPAVQWYIMEGRDHPSVRTVPANPDELIDFVQFLAPDLTFCRSSDRETVSHFPGTVRFIMEGGAPPFATAAHWVSLRSDLFDHGILPELTADQRAYLCDRFDPAWQAMQTSLVHLHTQKQAIFEAYGVPTNKPVLLLPLEYEHRENFFLMHRVGARPNHRLVAEIAEHITPHCTLVITNHPLNNLHVSNDALYATLSDLGDDVILADDPINGLSSTQALMPHADAVILGDSKAFTLAAFFGTPILRRSHFDSADWLNITTDFEQLLDGITAGDLPRPDQEYARLWFAFHFANDIFAPDDPALTADILANRALCRVNPARWDKSLAHFNTSQPEHA